MYPGELHCLGNAVRLLGSPACAHWPSCTPPPYTAPHIPHALPTHPPTPNPPTHPGPGPCSTWDSAGDQPGEGRLRAELQLLSVLPPEELLCPLSAAAAAEAAAGAATSHQGAAGGCSPIVHLGLAGQRGSSAPELVTVQSAAGGVAVLRPRGRDRPEAGKGLREEARWGWGGACQWCTALLWAVWSAQRGSQAGAGLRCVVRCALLLRDCCPLTSPASPGVRFAVQVTVRVQAGTPLAAARAHLAQLTLLGPSGIAALPAGAAASAATARTASPGDLQWGACGGLNGSAVVAAVEQEPHGHAAYAVADDGRLLVLLLGGSGGKKGCQVRAVGVGGTAALLFLHLNVLATGHPVPASAHGVGGGYCPGL